MNTFFLRIRQAVLFIGDIIILYFSLFLTFSVRYGTPLDSELWEDHLWPFTILFLMWIVVFYINNLYEIAFAKNDVRFFRRFFENLAAIGLIAIGFFYLTPSVGIAPKTNLFLFLFFFASLFFAWRALGNRFINARVWKEKILFVGKSSDAKELYLAINSLPQYGFELAAVLPEDGNRDLPEGIKILNNVGELERTIKNEHIESVVLGTKLAGSTELARALYNILFLQVNFVDASAFMESITGCIPTSRLTEAWFLENLKETKKKIYSAAKKILDYTLAVILLFILLFLIPLLAVINFIIYKGPLFYSQMRIGAMGKPFLIYKFRTMLINAETNGAVFAQKNDPRVTKFGKFLRRTRIDELPQIWNILRGEMSFIGPRPERPEFVSRLQEAMPFYNLRHLVKPGLTGWAQISFPYAGTIEENLKKLQYDLYYVKNRSLILDLAIMLKTINIVLRWMGR